MTKKQKNVLIRILVSALLVLFFFALDRIFHLSVYTRCFLFFIPYLLIGFDILKKAGKGIKNRQVFDENFLMAVATVGALFLGEFLEAVAVMLFYQIGELFQSLAVGKSRKNIAALMDIRPDYANLCVGTTVTKVDPDEVEVGSMLVVNPGERVPIDGVITQGYTTLNTGALTGESLPRDAKEGDEIYSGCINLSGRILVKTTKEFDESTVSKILELVENSSMKKAKSENFITRFAKYYTPLVCYLAVALAIVPPLICLLSGVNPAFLTWIERALTFLVISCPCALVISIPLSFFGGIGCASANGILVKGSNYLEALSKTKYVVFDKTGTLTKGVFEVSGIYPSENRTKDELLRFAAYAEIGSSHPISESLQKAFGKEIEEDRVCDIQEIAGHGVSATVEGKKVLAGNNKLMQSYGISSAKEQGTGTIVHVAVNGQYAGHLVISDVMKETAPLAIKMLKESGVKKTVMLTGDTKRAAEHIAQTLGMDEMYCDLLPKDKVTLVERLLEEKNAKEMLAFVGDGINDAPVLSRADIGIAMGALGSDAAIEAADIVLMDDDMEKIVLARKISVRTLRIVQQNIVFALCVKVICLVLGAFGIANMWVAIFADVGVMVLAVCNAMRALKCRA